MTNDEFIIKFLDKSLTSEEKSLFDKKMTTEPDFVKEVKAALQVIALLRTQKDTEIAEEWEKESVESGLEAEKVARGWKNAKSENRWKLLILWGCLLLVLLAISIWGILKYRQNNTIVGIADKSVISLDTVLGNTNEIDSSNIPALTKDSPQIVTLNKPKFVQDLSYLAALDSLNRQKKAINALTEKGAYLNEKLRQMQLQVNECKRKNGGNMADNRIIKYDFNCPIWMDKPDSILPNQSISSAKQSIVEKQETLVKLNIQFNASLKELENEVRIWANEVKKYCK